jgi:hypothetical protein
MRRTFILVLIFAGFLPFNWFLADRTAQAQERIRIAPASDGVELDEIKIVRWSARGAVKEADLTNMEIRLWTIEDDTGKLLSTENRRQQIHYLRGEVRGDVWKRSDKEGPEIRLMLEAPARKAVTLKSIKGKAEVSLAKPVNLTFIDLAAINGKVLEHPDMKSLKDLKLKSSVEEKNGRITATLKSPMRKADLGRLYEWDLLDGKKPISLLRRGGGSFDSDGGETTEIEYNRRSFKELTLRLVVLEPVETKTFNFEFRDIDLP